MVTEEALSNTDLWLMTRSTLSRMFCGHRGLNRANLFSGGVANVPELGCSDGVDRTRFLLGFDMEGVGSSSPMSIFLFGGIVETEA